MTCMSLSGCQELDEARRNHALYNENGSITLNGMEYKALPQCTDLQPDIDFGRTIYVTEEDVPVLLSSSMGDYYDISTDEMFLLSGVSGLKNGVDGLYSENVYCREDKYGEVRSKIEGGNYFTGYCYEYYDYSAEDNSVRYYKLTSDEIAAVETVLMTGVPELVSMAVGVDYDYMIELEACSEDMLFRRWSFDLYVKNGVCFLAEYSDTDIALYPVPDELEHTFDNIVSDYIEAEESLMNSFTF